MMETVPPATAAQQAVARVEAALVQQQAEKEAVAGDAMLQGLYTLARRPAFAAAAPAEEDDLPLLFDTRPSSGAHNSLCLVAMVLLLLWLVHLLLRLFTLRRITRQLRLQQTPVVLRGLACYADDLQRLARAHFEKVVRSHTPAAPIALLRVRVAAQVKAVRAAAAAARSGGNAEDVALCGRRFQSPAAAAGAAAVARARAAAAQRAADAALCSRPASEQRQATQDEQQPLQEEQQQRRVGKEKRGEGDPRLVKQQRPQQNRTESQLLRLGSGQSSSRQIEVVRQDNEEERGVAAAGDGRTEEAAAAARTAAAAAALGEGVGAAEDLELLVDAAETTHIFVYWGVDVRALQRLLDKKEEEPQALARGFLQEPLRRLPQSMRQLFGRRFRPGGGSAPAAAQSDVSRSLLELEHLDGTESPSPAAAAAAGGRRRGETSCFATSQEHLAPSEYRLRSKLVVVPAGLNQKVLVSPRDPGCVLGSFGESAAAGDSRSSAAGATTAAGEAPLEAPLVVISTGLLPVPQLLREVAHLSSTPLYEADTHVLVLRLAQPATLHGLSFAAAAARYAPGAAAEARAAVAAGNQRGEAPAGGAGGAGAAGGETGDARGRGAAPAAHGRAAAAAGERKPVAAEIWKEIVMGGSLGRAQERLDVYGLEDGGSSSSASPPFSDKECLVCMSSPKDVVLYPCRHCSLCSDCLRSLHQERCPICRSSFSAFLTFPLRRTHTYYPPASSSSSSAAPGAAAASSSSSSPSYFVSSSASTSPLAAAAAGEGSAGSATASAATPATAAAASSSAAGSSAFSLFFDAPAAPATGPAAAAGVPAGRRQPAADAAPSPPPSPTAAASSADASAARAAALTPQAQQYHVSDQAAAQGPTPAAQNGGASQAPPPRSPPVGGTPLGGLLSQMRHYVQYDELGGDEASDSSG